MQVSTLPIDREDFANGVWEYCFKLQQNIERVFRKDLEISFGKNINKLFLIDAIRIVHETKAISGPEKIVRNIILEMMTSAKLTFGGAEIYALLSFISCIEKNKIEDDTIYEFSKKANKANIKDLDRFLKSIDTDIFSKTLIYQILKIGGINCRVNVKEGNEYDSRINFVNGYKFEAHLNHNFQISISKEELRLTNCGILLVDGVISRVSEIHHLLEKYTNSSSGLIIAARGFEEEVIATLAVNFKRKTLRVVPVQLPNILENINSIKDIAVVSQSEIISSLKGDLISAFDIEKIKTITSAKISGREFIITNKINNAGLNSHISHLQELISKENFPDKITLLEKRISSLTPNIANIILGTSLKENRGIIKDRINSLIGMCSAMCLTGIVNIDSDVDELTSSNLAGNVLPAGSFLEGTKIGIKTANTLKNINTMIVIDE